MKTQAVRFRCWQVAALTRSTGNTVTAGRHTTSGYDRRGHLGTGWSCMLATLTCTRSDGLSANTSYPVINLTVNVSPTATTPLVNSATVSGAAS